MAFQLATELVRMVLLDHVASWLLRASLASPGSSCLPTKVSGFPFKVWRHSWEATAWPAGVT